LYQCTKYYENNKLLAQYCIEDDYNNNGVLVLPKIVSSCCKCQQNIILELYINNRFYHYNSGEITILVWLYMLTKIELCHNVDQYYIEQEQVPRWAVLSEDTTTHSEKSIDDCFVSIGPLICKYKWCWERDIFVSFNNFQCLLYV
jgi:hypothetical protein